LVVTHNAEIAERTQHIISIRDGLIEKDEYLQRLDTYSMG
jgi:ABC-type lipoprotein export system ATPase subunit